MFYRYNLKAFHDKELIYDGCFSTLNKAVKVSCMFDSHVVLECYDLAFDKIVPIETLVVEFDHMVTGI